MTVIEKINEINEIIKDIFEFTQADDKVRTDFNEYLATIGARDISINQMEKAFLPYIFERRIDDKSILEMYKETSKNKDLAESLINAQSSIFSQHTITPFGNEFNSIFNFFIFSTPFTLTVFVIFSFTTSLLIYLPPLGVTT